MAVSKQLVSQFNPDEYNLSLELNKNQKTFTGKLQIKGSRRSKPSYRITLNQSGLRVSNVKLYRQDKGVQVELKVSRVVHHNKLQELRIHTEQQIVSGKYEIELEYAGSVTSKGTNGIYVSKWVEESSKLNEIIATQFEPHYARGLLPCIDEPQAKAIFNLSLTLKELESVDKVLFNTKVASLVIKSKSEQRLDFEPTPVMSTYLLALVVGYLDKQSATSKNGTEVSVYATPDKIENASFALDLSVKVLDLLEDKFKIKYPLSKLDLVAVPDFESSAAMENWGLIIFREDYLLYDRTISTLMDKQAIAQVIAHEIAHQWFGNLVTMKWWDELWLNEGFANFMEYYVIDSIYPEWKMFEGYLVNEKSYAIRVDSLPSSRPIIKKVTSSHHALEAFDGIAYEKSGNIIRMIFSMIGEANFMLGLNDYFAKHAYKVASSGDLIKSWQKYTNLNLSKFVNSWLNEPGLPKVSVSLGTNQKQIVLEQARFLSEASPKQSIEVVQTRSLKLKPNIKPKQRVFYKNLISNKYSKNHSSIWNIPINFVYADRTGKNRGKHLGSFVMTKPKHIVQLSSQKDLPVKLNAQGAAFYITSYSNDFLAGISRALSSNQLDDLDTLGLLTDIISLNRAHQFEPGGPAILEIIKSAKNTSSPQFWTLVGGFIGYLHYHLKQTSQENLLQGYVQELVFSKLETVGFNSSPSDSPETVMSRFELLSLAALAREPQCLENLTNLYRESLKAGIETLESEKRLLALYSVAKFGKKSDHKQLLDIYKQSISDPNLKEDLSYALCLFEDEAQVRSNIAVMQDPELVRSQDIISWLSQICSAGQKATQISLKWIQKEGGWNWLQENLSSQDLSTAVKVVISTAFTNKDLTKLKNFFEKLDNIELEKALQEALDIAKSRIMWHKKELPSVIEYLC